jgi:glutathione peroxidase
VKKCCVLAVLFLVPGLIRAEGKKVSGPLSFTMKGIDGKDVDLSKYKGKVVVFVNVASQCGLTPQYKGLQQMHDKYAKDGLVIIGVPCNQFNKQEPGSDKEIAEFCTKEYNVTFPMLSKVQVNGDGACDLFKYLNSKKKNPKGEAKIDWNFTKFLINKKGEVAARFEPRSEPETMIEVIEAELKK